MQKTDQQTTTDTKLVKFEERELGCFFPVMVTRFDAPRGSIPHYCGYLGEWRQFAILSQNAERYVVDVDVRRLRDKHPEAISGTAFADFLGWLDSADWDDIEDGLETSSEEWGDGRGE